MPKLLMLIMLVVACLGGCHTDKAEQTVVAIFNGASPLFVEADRPMMLDDLDIRLNKDHKELQEVVRDKRQQYDDLKKRNPNDPELMRYRNEIIQPLTVAILHYHEGTLDDLYQTATVLETLFDWTSLGLTASIPLVGSEGTKEILGAVAAAVIGGRKALEANILAERTKYAVMLTMKAERLTALTDLRDSLRKPDDGSDDAVSLDEALSLAYDLYAAGSVREAVTELTRHAEQDLKAAEDHMAEPRGGE